MERRLPLPTSQLLVAKTSAYAALSKWPPENSVFTKADSCHRLVGVATRLLLLIRREPMQKPVAHGRLGDKPAVSACMAAPSQIEGAARSFRRADDDLFLVIEVGDAPLLTDTGAVGFRARRHRRERFDRGILFDDVPDVRRDACSWLVRIADTVSDGPTPIGRVHDVQRGSTF